MLHSKSIFSLVDFGTQVWKSCNLISQKIYYLLVPSISLIIVLIFFFVCELLHSQILSSSQVFCNFPMEGLCMVLFSLTVPDTSSIWQVFCVISFDNFLPALFTQFFLSGTLIIWTLSLLSWSLNFLIFIAYFPCLYILFFWEFSDFIFQHFLLIFTLFECYLLNILKLFFSLIISFS